MYLLSVIHLVYFTTRHLFIYLTACSIIFNLNIDYNFFTFLINFTDAILYIVIVKHFELYMDFALYKINILLLCRRFDLLFSPCWLNQYNNGRNGSCLTWLATS